MPERPTPMDDACGTWVEFQAALERFLTARAAEAAWARIEASWARPAHEPGRPHEGLPEGHPRDVRVTRGCFGALASPHDEGARHDQ
jgi:hypothetical protein